MEHIKDVLYIKTLERRLRRRLSEDEMDGQPFMACFPDGHYEVCRVPLLSFPWDVIDSRSLAEGSKNKLVKNNLDEWIPRANPPEYVNIWSATVRTAAEQLREVEDEEV